MQKKKRRKRKKKREKRKKRRSKSAHVERGWRRWAEGGWIRGVGWLKGVRWAGEKNIGKEFRGAGWCEKVLEPDSQTEETDRQTCGKE